MTRSDLIHKWLVYALALLPVWLMDAYVLSRYPILGVTPMLLPLAAAAVAVMEGAFAGTGFGMAVGLLWELGYAGGFGGLVFGMALAGMGMGTLAQYALSQSFPGYFLCACLLVGALDGLRIFRELFIQSAALPALLEVAVPEFLLTMAWSPAVYLLFRAVYRRVGGTKLA